MKKIIALVLVLFIGSCGDDDDGKKGADASNPSSSSQLTTCEQIDDCIFACEDEACAESCQARSNEQTFAKYAVVIVCSGDQCNYDSNCTASACRAELEACGFVYEDDGGGTGGGGGGQTPGSHTCGAVLDCAFECEADSCYEACFSRADEESFQLLGVVVDCFDVCDTSVTPDCCTSEVNACYADT